MCNDCPQCRANVEKDLKQTAKKLGVPDMSHDPVFIYITKQAWCHECEQCHPTSVETYSCVRKLVDAADQKLSPELRKLVGYELNRLAFRVPQEQRYEGWL